MHPQPEATSQDEFNVLFLRPPRPGSSRAGRWLASLLIGALGTLAFALAALLCLLFDRGRPARPVTSAVPRHKPRERTPLSPANSAILGTLWSPAARPRSLEPFREPSLPALVDEANHPQYHPTTPSAIR